MKVFFPNLDGLRFVAFFLVFWQHGCYGFFTELQRRGVLSEAFTPLFATGGVGVSFFFVLSGFLITFLLLSEIKEKGKVNLKAFYVRRVLRIFPLYYFVIFFSFGVYPLFRLLAHLAPVDNGSFWAHLFFLSNFDRLGRTDGSLFAGVTWSVSVEEQFYIVWAFLIALLPAKTYKYLFPLFIVASTLFRAFFANDLEMYFHTFSVVSDLAIGGGMAYLTVNRQGFVEYFKNLSRFSIICGYLFGLIWTFVLPIVAPQNAGISRLVSALFFAFVIAEQNYSVNSLLKFGDYKTVSKLGIYTYGLYLLHPIALFIVSIGFGKIVEQSNLLIVAAYAVIGLALSLLMAIISYKFYETPFLKLKKRFEV